MLVFVLLIGTLLSSVAFAADVDTTDWVVAEDIKIKTTAHIQKDGDKDFSGNGQIWFGTTGEKKRVEEISIGLEGEVPEDMRIMYMAHVQKDGDTKWTEDPNPAGTHGEAKRIEGIAIKLVDEAGKEYPGYVAEYQVHMAQYGWGINETKNDKNDDNKINDSYKEWASNGTYAGTRGEARRIEAVRLRIRREDELKVKSVSAISAKTLEVKFNQAADVKAEDFTVNKGTVKTNIASVALSEDKTVATIELTSKMTKGDYTVTVAQEDADALVATVTVDDEKVSKIEVTSDVAPITSSPSPYEAKVGVKVLNQYDEDITKLNHSDVTVTVGGAATSGTLDLEGVLTLTLAPTAKEGDSVYITLVHGKTGVVAQETVKVSRAAAISKVTFGELYNKDGKTLNQDTDVTKDKFYLPVSFEDQYGEEITALGDITGKITVTNSNPGVATVTALKTVKIDNKDTNVLEVDSVNLAGSTNIIVVANETGANATTALTVDEGVKVASISLGSPEELVTAGKKILFPLTITDTAGNELETKKEFYDLNAKDSITINGPTGTEVVEVKDKGLFVEVKAGQVSENVAVTVVVTTSTGKVATQTVVPKEAAEPTVITGISSKKATSVRAGDTTGVTIANTDLIVEDQFGQVIKDEDILGTITFEIEEDPSGIFTITQPDSDKKSYKIVAIDPIADANVKSSKLTFKLATGTAAEKAASAFTKTFSVVEDSQFASYEVEDVKTMYAYEGDGITSGKEEGKFYVDPAYNQDIKVKAKTAAGEVVELTEDIDFTVTGKPADDAEVKFAKDAKEAKVIVTITINRTGEQLTKELTYSNVAPKVVDFLFADDMSEADLTKVKSLEDPVDLTGPVAAASFKLKNASDDTTDLTGATIRIITVDQYGKKAEASLVGTITFVPEDASKVTITGNGTATASVVKSGAEDANVTAKVKIGDVTKEIKVVVK